MPKLNQVIAVEKGAKGHLNDKITSTYHLLQKPDLFKGLSRTYQPRDDAGEQLPPEHQKVQLQVESLLSEVSGPWTRLLDITATKDWANTEARANVVVDSATVIADAPVTFLVWLEKQLVDMRTLIGKLPKLDPGTDWSHDASTSTMAARSVETTRTKKVPRAHILYEATTEHPAQVQAFTEDVIEGYWTKIDFSGAISQDRVDQLLSRVDALQEAVKTAREEANGIEAQSIHVGPALFEYLLAE